MRLADINVDELVEALGKERSRWIDVAKEEGRQHTDAERVTICVLSALQHALQIAESNARNRTGQY
jgi:hypothetical protein